LLVLTENRMNRKFDRFGSKRK